MTSPAEYEHIATALQSSLVQAMEAAERARNARDETVRILISEQVNGLRITLEAVREKAGRR